MYLDYSKITLDKNGNPEQPTLSLRTLSNEVICPIRGVSGLRFNIKYAEVSTVEFDIPANINLANNASYGSANGFRLVYTETYGIYVIKNPESNSDGFFKTKHITGQSIESLLDNRKFSLEEGTFKFYDQTNQNNPDTVIGRILEVATDWSVGYVDPTIASKYRTFDQYDDNLLGFIYNNAPEKYRCAFVFDPYLMTINVYDSDSEYGMLPIYMDFDNLVKNSKSQEKSDELITAIRPYGADGLDIRDVNPIGTNWIYNIDYFINNGDIPSTLATKWRTWQASIKSNRNMYNGLVALRASTTASLLSLRAKIVDLKAELETLQVQQSIIIQGIAIEETEEGKQELQDELDSLNERIMIADSAVTSESYLAEVYENLLDPTIPTSYVSRINAIVNSLSIKNYFTTQEYNTLSKYFIENDVSDETFVATAISQQTIGDMSDFSYLSATIQNSKITMVEVQEFNKVMYNISGGDFYFASGSSTYSGDVIRGTIEITNNNAVVSVYAGSVIIDSNTYQSGLITINADISTIDSDIEEVVEQGVSTYEGTFMSFVCYTGSMYATTNVSDYQKYSVQMELFEYAENVLADISSPSYEFSVDSANFLFSDKFKNFRDNLKLGSGIYLNIGDGVLNPRIIEFAISFDDISSLSAVFSNRYKRIDNCNVVKSMIEQSYSSSRKFDASRYTYNQVSNQASAVEKFMNSSLDAAKNSVIAAANQSVIIDGAGIHIGGASQDQIRIVDNMIAMSDDNWSTAKLAIGRFYSPDVGSYFGVNAEVIGGKLIVGNSLILENIGSGGAMQFKIDSSGAWLNNSTFVLQEEGGGKIILDPKYGFAAGNGSLYSVSGTIVTPSFIDTNGDIIFDNDDMPQNSNFYIDIDNGNAYFRGDILATSGRVGGFTISNDFLHAGSSSSYVAINGSGSNQYSQYVMWAGAENPSSASFFVKKNGDIYAKSGNINADTVVLGSTSGGFKCAEGYDGTSTTNGAMMYGSDPNYYFIATNRGVRMQSTNQSLVISNNRIVASTTIETSSDARLKNSVSSEMSAYESFYKSLKPCSYKYNNGTSGRFHIGFIAQEVESALINNGLSTNDFAGIIKCNGEDDIHTSFDDEYSLRYSEFIALNTYMIQSLMNRVSELEANQKKNNGKKKV